MGILKTSEIEYLFQVNQDSDEGTLVTIKALTRSGRVYNIYGPQVEIESAVAQILSITQDRIQNQSIIRAELLDG